MKIIIPVAGAGTRLQPHTLTTPKVLLPVGGRPMLAQVLDPLISLHPEEVIFVIGHLGEQIRAYVESAYTFKSTFVTQRELLGLGYALHLAIEATTDAPLLIILGDTIVDCDFETLCKAGDYVLGVRSVDDPERFGIAEVANNVVTKLEEKPKQPKSNLALIGLYYFKESKSLRAALRTLVKEDRRTAGEIQLTDALSDMITRGTMFLPFEVSGWYDCGKKETLLSTNRHLLERLSPPQSIKGSILRPPIYVDPEARVINSIVGPNVSVQEEAVIENTIVRNSIIGAGARVKDSVLEDSLIGSYAVVTGERQQVNIGDRAEVLL